MEDLYPYVLNVFILIPAITATLIITLPATAETLIRRFTVTGAFVNLILGVWLFGLSRGGEAELALLTPKPIPWVDSLGITWSVAADGMSVVMVLLTTIVMFTGSLVSAHGIKTQVKEYFVLLNALVVGVFAVFLVRDLFFMYFGFELAVIPMYLLIGIWGSGNKEYAAMKLTLYLTAGALLALAGLLLIYFETWDYLRAMNAAAGPSFHLDDVLAAAHSGDPRFFDFEFQQTAFALMFLGFASIIPMWPMHTWSPIGHAAAPSAGSMMHAGVLMKLGAYAILRVVIPSCPDGAAFWLPYVAIVSCMNIVYGGLVAMAQKDMKFIVGFSSSSHMGYTLLGIASATVIGVSGAVFLMFAHGVMTALAFSLIGFFYDQTHNRWVPDLGGLAHQLPFIGTCFAIMCMASAGVPGFANFASEFMIMFGAWEGGYEWQAVVAVFGVVISAVYLLRAVRNAFWGPRNERWDKIEDARGLVRLPYLLLIGILLFFGFYPKPMTDVIQQSVKPTVKLVQDAQAELGGRTVETGEAR